MGLLFLLLMGSAHAAVAATSQPDPCASAAQLVSQGQLAKAEAALAQLPKGTTCPSVAAAIADRDKSALQRLDDDWSGFYDSQVAPLGSLLLPFLGVLLILLVLTRLLVMWVPRWGEIGSIPEGEDGPASGRTPVAVLGLASLVGGSFLLTIGAAHTQQGPLNIPGRPALITAWVIGMILFVAAIIWAHQQSDLNKPTFPLWLAVIGAALGIVALAPMLLRTTDGDNDAMGWVDVWAVLLLGVLLGALGIWLTAWWLATRLRLSITYTDSAGADQKTMAALVAAYLNELGAERPKGLEVPVGTDVTALAGALATLPDNPVLKALTSFLSGLTGVTPWTASIDAGKDAVAVSLRRNARSIGSAVLDPSALRLAETDSATSDSTTAGGPHGGSPATDDAKSTEVGGDAATDDVLRMAAAFVLATMAPHHRAITRGLAGATDWKSLGYHYIATAGQAGGSGDHDQVLLAQALNEDPGNRLARLAFRWALARTATDSRSLIDYAAFLAAAHTDLVDHKDQFDVESLILRVRYVRALILINAAYAYASETGKLPDETSDQVLAGRATALSELQNEAVTAMKSLHAELNPSVAAKDADELAHFKAQFRDDIKGTMFLLGLDSEARQADTPIGMYNLGATYASRNDLPWPDATRLRGPVEDAVNADDARAVVLLTHACKDPRNKAWLADDPQLERFRQRAAYRNAFLAKPRDDFFELDPVRPIADRLRASGYGTAWRLASESAQQLELRTYVSAATCAQVIALARLRISLGAYSASTTAADEKPLDEWAVEVLDELLGHGLASEDALAALTDAERVSTMTRVANAVLGRCRLGEGRDPGAYAGSLSGWLTAWSSQP